MEESLGSSILLNYSCRCYVREPQPCFYGSYSQPSSIPPSLNPHVAIRGREKCCDTHTEHLVEGLRTWVEMSADDSLIWEGLGYNKLQHSLLWHWSLGFTLGALWGSPDLSSPPPPPFFFLPPCCPALKQDCNIRMASWAGMVGDLCCARQAD